MGSLIEINDTLKISKERGFPATLLVAQHVWQPYDAETFKEQTFSFWNPDERLYHRCPTRVFLVEEMPNKEWLYWGHAHVIRQTIMRDRTEGIYQIAKLYTPRDQLIITTNEAPTGKSYYPQEQLEWLLTAEGGRKPLWRLQEYVAGKEEK